MPTRPIGHAALAGVVDGDKLLDAVPTGFKRGPGNLPGYDPSGCKLHLVRFHQTSRGLPDGSGRCVLNVFALVPLSGDPHHRRRSRQMSSQDARTRTMAFRSPEN